MTNISFMEKLKKPNNDLFFKSHDPNDIRLGAMTSHSSKDYEQCEFVLLGCPQDYGVKRNKGRVGTAKAPNSIRDRLYRLAAPAGLKKGQLLDLGDTPTNGSLEEIHDRHRLIVETILKDQKIAIILGGGNDISYPDAKAVQSVFQGSLTVNIDAHLDIRISKERNSGTPYRQLLEEKLISAESFYEIGYQYHANSPKYLSDAEEMGINMLPLNSLLKTPIKKGLDKLFVLDTSQTCFLGFDMDAVKAGDAPGVSAPSPTGLSAEQAVEIVEFLSIYKNTRLFEITEVNPNFDADARTSKLAAILVFRFLSRCLEKNSL
jgi:formimidoylglutamase